MTKFFALTIGVAAALALATPGVSNACGRGFCFGCGPCYDYCDCYGWQGCGYCYRPCYDWIDTRFGCCQAYAPSYWYASSGTVVYPAQAYNARPQVVAANTAHIHVTVPAGAKLWFDDEGTTQTSSERFFESPPLTPGDHRYNIKAQWRDQDGKVVTRTRHVDVRANASIDVDFREYAE
jgi:uncharacterized protein (TIGR03000 family)